MFSLKLNSTADSKTFLCPEIVVGFIREIIWSSTLFIMIELLGPPPVLLPYFLIKVFLCFVLVLISLHACNKLFFYINTTLK